MTEPIDDEHVSFTTRPAHRWGAGETWLEEQVLPFSRRGLGECRAAVFGFGGDVEAASREAAHATVLRALADDHVKGCARTELQAERVTWETFLRGRDGRHGLLYALFDGPYPMSPQGKRHEVASWWLTELLGDWPRPADLALREWSTDGYDPWFRSGREWWGTFLWTAAWPARGVLVGITASSTD